MSTHVLADADRVCDDVVIMTAGRAVVAEPAADLRRNYASPAYEVTWSGTDLGPTLRGLDFVAAAEGDGPIHRLLLAGGDADLPRLLRALAEVPGSLERLERKTPTLEDIFAEAHRGTLEQLFLGRYGFGVAAAGHVASAMLFLLVQNFLLLVVMLLITGQRVYFDAGPVLAATVTLLLQGCGIGLITGGLALVVKQVQRAQETLFLGLILLVAIPIAEAPALVVAPLSLAADILRRTMVDGAPFGALAGDLALSAVLAIGYLVLGWSAFRLCERVVKARGSLALY